MSEKLDNEEYKRGQERQFTYPDEFKEPLEPTPFTEELRKLVGLSVNRSRRTLRKMTGQVTVSDFMQSKEFFSTIRKNLIFLDFPPGLKNFILFPFLLEAPEKFNKMNDYPFPSAEQEFLKQTVFIMAHGNYQKINGPTLSADDFSRYAAKVDERGWSKLWLNYALLRLAHTISIPGLTLYDSRHQGGLECLLEMANSSQATLASRDNLVKINRWLQDHNMQIWLFYDELDLIQNSTLRQLALEELLSWWKEMRYSTSNIIPKIFLRQENWESLNFANKVHYFRRIYKVR